MYAPELEAQERRHERISAMVTLVAIILFFVVAFVDHLLRDRVPPPGEKEYEVVGAIDFGNYTQGSRNINNFEPPAENPAPTPAPAQPAASNTSSNPSPSNEITQPDVSPVAQPSTPRPQPTPNPSPPQEQPQPDPQPSESTTSSNTNDQTQPQEEELEFEFDQGGSNQGNAESGTGNAGTPSAQTLDPAGLFSWEDGGGSGPPGRSAVALPYPSYTAQEEGRITFELTIRPDGGVSYVKAVSVVTKPALRDAGIAAIKRWKFTPLPPSAPQVTTRTRVTITFKLR